MTKNKKMMLSTEKSKIEKSLLNNIDKNSDFLKKLNNDELKLLDKKVTLKNLISRSKLVNKNGQIYYGDSKVLIQYIKNSKNKKIGTLVGFFDKNKIKIGWSLCNLNFDIFDKKRGLEIAVARALVFDRHYLKQFQKVNRLEDLDCPHFIDKIPFSVRKSFLKFYKRCEKYFKNVNFESWIEEFIKSIED